jgi:hypothetical protein
VNANPLAASIFSATTAGTVQHEIVKKDVDCIIAEVDRDGMCECFRVIVGYYGKGANTTASQTHR